MLCLKITDRLFRYATSRLRGISFLIHFFSLIIISLHVIRLVLHVYHSVRRLYFHHFHQPLVRYQYSYMCFIYALSLYNAEKRIYFHLGLCIFLFMYV